VTLERYEAERRQGERFAREDLEHAWGWSSPAGRVRAARRARFLIDATQLAPGVRCLELGCGTGEFTTRLADSGCDLTAIDISEASVRRCRERVGDRAEVVVGNIETGEGLEGREFDAVVGVSVLHHVDVDACLNAIGPLVRVGGRLAFSEPNRANPQVWAERRFATLRRLRHVLPHETAFVARELAATFERHGFSVETAEPFEFLHAATPARLIDAVLRLERLLESTPARAIAGSVRVVAVAPG
jgi:SAM-dependent methyltransferase